MANRKIKAQSLKSQMREYEIDFVSRRTELVKF